MGVRATYYVENLTGPLKHAICAMMVELAYLVFLFTKPIDGHPVWGPVIRCLVHGYAITATVFLLQAIGLRFFALQVP
jgi:hypothetical protein